MWKDLSNYLSFYPDEAWIIFNVEMNFLRKHLSEANNTANVFAAVKENIRKTQFRHIIFLLEPIFINYISQAQNPPQSFALSLL
jgi:hypothetical protein